MDGERKQASEVLVFWFVQSRPRQWFAKDPAGAPRRARRLGRARLPALSGASRSIAAGPVKRH
jgi:uncharacterized protein (DUF924 family)